MKKKLIYLTLLVAIVVLGVLIFVKNTKSTYKQSDIQFSIESTEEVDSIIIRSGDMQFELTKKNLVWTTTHQHEANEPLVAFVLETLKNIEMQYPVAKENEVAFKDSIKKLGNTITLYKANKEIYKLNFYEINNKTIALNKKDIPFVIGVKGKSDLSLSKLLIAEEMKWAKRVLIDLNPAEIAKVFVKYTQSDKNSFGLSREKFTVKITDLSENEVTGTSEENISDFLYYFKGITYSLRDTLKNSEDYKTELFQLSILSADNKALIIKAYPLFDKKMLKKNINLFVGIVNNADTVYLKYTDFDPILVDKEYFLKN